LELRLEMILPAGDGSLQFHGSRTRGGMIAGLVYVRAMPFPTKIEFVRLVNDYFNDFFKLR
jgi:hypothetical protein